jgi:acyl-CoA reductase-like NAD-dependent aldehyde dehydrogenase
MVGIVASLMRVAVECARQVPLEEVRRDAQGAVVVRQEPRGVIAALVPTNGPLSISVLKVVPALLAGCPVILKGSEDVPLSPFFLADVFEEAGLPPGMLNVLAGGSGTGERMVTHPGVDMVSFTGSTSVGRKIAEATASSFKHLSLELGGKSAGIMLDDADLDVAVRTVGSGVLANAGQYCRALSRFLVPRTRHDEAVDALVAFAREIVPGENMGPLVNPAAVARVERYVQSARDEGARVLTGGRRPQTPAKGYFYEPTVIVDATNQMTFAREEIFGPVVAVIAYDTVDDAVAVANDNDYGLSGSVFGRDLHRAYEVACRVRTGTTGVNLHGARSCAPCGGVKDSGVGQEHGPEGFLEVLTPKAIAVPEELAREFEARGMPSRPALVGGVGARR